MSVHLEHNSNFIRKLLDEQAQRGVRTVEELKPIRDTDDLPVILQALSSAVIGLQSQVTTLSIVCSNQQREIEALKARTRWKS